METNWDTILDALEMIGGVYLAYQGYAMKKNGKLTEWSLIGKGISLEKARDIPGFINNMHKAYIICGISFSILGAAGLYNDLTNKMTPTLYLIILSLLILDIAIFSAKIVMAQKRYLIPKM